MTKRDNRLDVIILAGGYAKRLAPISDFIPKPLVPILGRPALSYLIDGLNVLCGEIDFMQVYLTVNKQFEHHFKNYLRYELLERMVNRFDIELIVEDSSCDKEKPGPILATCRAFANHVIGNRAKEVMILAGDSYSSLSLSDFYDFYLSGDSSAVALYKLKDESKGRNYGCAKLDDDEISAFEEKPANPEEFFDGAPALVNTTYQILKFDDMMKMCDYQRGKYPGGFMKWLVEDERTPVRGYVFNGDFVDIGTPELLLEANECAKYSLMEEERYERIIGAGRTG